MTRFQKLFTVACAAVALFCAGYIALYFLSAQSARGALQALALQKSAAEPTAASDPEPGGILPEYALLRQQNADLAGWLTIDGTEVDYPVMQSAENEYYLHRGFDREEVFRGLPFMDNTCDLQNGSTGFFIYGHNMRDGTMFGGLKAYLDEDFYLEHRTIRFDTVYERGSYEILSVFLSEVYGPQDDGVFKYYQHTVLPDRESFEQYVASVAALSVHDTGVTAQWGDTLLTLSTCSRHTENGRLVVVAKKVG